MEDSGEKGRDRGECGSKRKVAKYEKTCCTKKKREGRGGRENVGGKEKTKADCWDRRRRRRRKRRSEEKEGEGATMV